MSTDENYDEMMAKAFKKDGPINPKIVEEEKPKQEPFSVVKTTIVAEIDLFDDRSFNMRMAATGQKEILAAMIYVRKAIYEVYSMEMEIRSKGAMVRKKDPRKAEPLNKSMTNTMLQKHVHTMDCLDRHINESMEFLFNKEKELAEKVQNALDLSLPKKNDEDGKPNG